MRTTAAPPPAHVSVCGAAIVPVPAEKKITCVASVNAVSTGSPLTVAVLPPDPTSAALFANRLPVAIATVIGLTIVNLAPVVAMKLANWKLRGIKHEARANPIETLQNQLADRRRQLAAFAATITEFNAAVKGFESKVAVFRTRATMEFRRMSAIEREQLAANLLAGGFAGEGEDPAGERPRAARMGFHGAGEH